MKKNNDYEGKIRKRDKVIKKNVDFKWVFQISILAFIISLAFSAGSNVVLENVNIYFGVLIVLLFIVIGVLFDMVGIAVASADDKAFHSMSTKRVKGSRTAVKMIKNAEKVSAFCNDVIGDICNIISGSAGAVIAVAISVKYNIDAAISALLVTSIIASLTIGGKATGKSFAINKSNVIIYSFSKVINLFIKEQK